MYAGVEQIWNTRFPHVKNKVDAEALLNAMYQRMVANRRTDGENGLTYSKENWRVKCMTHIADHNTSQEKLLEKAVAVLADNGHMSGWCNQVPTASGYANSKHDKHANVDLMRWDAANAQLRLIELKWQSNTLDEALYQAVKAGLAYIIFRAGGCTKPVMRAHEVSVEVVAPPHYFSDEYKAVIDSVAAALPNFANDKITHSPPVFSLNMRAFPSGFHIPFANGAEVVRECSQKTLTQKGQIVRDAFANLERTD